MKKIGQFTIEVYDEEDEDGGKVRIHADEDAGHEFSLAWMLACEYFLHLTAQKSPTGYERAHDLLRKGAMTYSTEGQDDIMAELSG